MMPADFRALGTRLLCARRRSFCDLSLFLDRVDETGFDSEFSLPFSFRLTLLPSSTVLHQEKRTCVYNFTLLDDTPQSDH